MSVTTTLLFLIKKKILASRSGPKQLLAVGFERGYVDILDMSQRDVSETREQLALYCFLG